MILPNVNDAKRIQTEFEYGFEGSGKAFMIGCDLKTSLAMRTTSEQEEDRPSRVEEKESYFEYFIGNGLICDSLPEFE